MTKFKTDCELISGLQFTIVEAYEEMCVWLILNIAL
jgi:hypothetical protein